MLGFRVIIALMSLFRSNITSGTSVKQITRIIKHIFRKQIIVSAGNVKYRGRLEKE